MKHFLVFMTSLVICSCQVEKQNYNGKYYLYEEAIGPYLEIQDKRFDCEYCTHYGSHQGEIKQKGKWLFLNSDSTYKKESFAVTIKKDTISIEGKINLLTNRSIDYLLVLNTRNDTLQKFIIGFSFGTSRYSILQNFYNREKISAVSDTLIFKYVFLDERYNTNLSDTLISKNRDTAITYLIQEKLQLNPIPFEDAKLKFSKNNINLLYMGRKFKLYKKQ